LDEYSLEPMVYKDGQFTALPALSGELAIEFPQPVALSKAILILHSEVATLPLSFADKGVKNVTFRLGMQPEFHEKLKFLVELGFAESEEIQLKNGSASPREVLNKIIQKSPPPTGEPDDCEVVRVDVTGTKDGQPALIRVETIVKADKQRKMSCDALDTIVPPSVVAQMIGSGQITARGVLAPEICVPPEPFFTELSKRDIHIRRHSLQAPNYGNQLAGKS
jgi:lysine 6-dehydrogenase